MSEALGTRQVLFGLEVRCQVHEREHTMYGPSHNIIMFNFTREEDCGPMNAIDM